MKRSLVLSISGAVALAGGALAAHAGHDAINFRAQLIGLNEVPPTNSRGTGQLHAQISADESTITFTLTYQDLTDAPLFAHIHFGQSRVNGGVMVFFCGGGGKPACPAAPSGTVSGMITAADIVGPAAQGIQPAPTGDFADVIRAIKTNRAYANVHTPQFQAGEIRGQVRVTGPHDHDDED